MKWVRNGAGSRWSVSYACEKDGGDIILSAMGNRYAAGGIIVRQGVHE